MDTHQLAQARKALEKLDEAKRLLEQAGVDTYTLDGEYVRVSQKIRRVEEAPVAHPAMLAAKRHAERTISAPRTAPPPRLSADPDADEHEAFATYHEAIVIATATLDPLYLRRFPPGVLTAIKRRALHHAAANSAAARLA